MSTQKRLGVTNVALGERFENGNVLAASTLDARLAQFVEIGVLGQSPEMVLQATSVSVTLSWLNRTDLDQRTDTPESFGHLR